MPQGQIRRAGAAIGRGLKRVGKTIVRGKNVLTGKQLSQKTLRQIRSGQYKWKTQGSTIGGTRKKLEVDAKGNITMRELPFAVERSERDDSRYIPKGMRTWVYDSQGTRKKKERLKF